MGMRRTDTGIIEGIDVIDFPLRPVKVMGNRIQIVEFLGHDRPSRITVQRFRKCRNFLTHDRLWVGEDQVLQ